MKKTEIWSVSLQRMQDFFRGAQDVTEENDGFRYRSCLISLTPLAPEKEDIFQIHRVIVTMDGSDPDVTEIYRRFFLQFLSAGG